MDEAASHLIFFIVGISLALGVSGVLLNSVQNLETGISVRGDAASKTILSDVAILHVNVGENVKVYTANNGKTPIDGNKTNLLMDGKWVSDNETTVEIVAKSTNKVNVWWDPGEVLLTTYSNTTALTAGRHKVKILTSDGVEDEYEFDT
ncbi:archaebacterial flagellin [archaeon BMS3Abin16]|nr:archaebacterial flagellin [archaeon BMS3Abin16]GBE56930.1 archaebacterial flagellin [archaeon BMS3Bbin16]HDY74719.1 hypothetical protein [Euryarchaeota archaeon]